MNRYVLLTCLVLLTVFPLSAQQNGEAERRPPSVAQVMKFFEVMHVHDQMQSMLQAEQKQFDVITKELFAKQLPNATPKQRANFEKFTSSAMNELMTNYPIDDVLRDMVPVYQAHFSESDLDQVIAFYSSATGKRMLKEMPAMMAEAMRVSYSRLQPQIEKLMKNLDANIKEMAKESKETAKPEVSPRQ